MAAKRKSDGRGDSTIGPHQPVVFGPETRIGQMSGLRSKLSAALGIERLQSLQVDRKEIALLIAALDDAARLAMILPRWVELETRLGRARVAARGKGARERNLALAREMGFSVAGGKRQRSIPAEERNLIALKFWELTKTNALAHFPERDVAWASGFQGAIEKGHQPKPVDASLMPQKRIVETPISPAEAVRVLVEWFPWCFGNLESARAFLVRARRELREERARLADSERPEDLAQLRSLPPADFAVPSPATLSKLR